MIASNGLPLPGCCGQQRAGRGVVVTQNVVSRDLWVRLWLLSTVANELWLLMVLRVVKYGWFGDWVSWWPGSWAVGLRLGWWDNQKADTPTVTLVTLWLLWRCV